MLLKPDQINSEFKGHWEAFAAQHPNGSVFQSPLMFDFFLSVKNYDPYVFAEWNKGEIAAVMLAVIIREYNGVLGILTTRALVYGGPLIQNSLNSKELLHLMLGELVQKLKKKAIFIQFRNFFEWSAEEKVVFGKHGFQFRDRLNLIVKTDNRERCLSAIKPGKRRQIKSSLRHGAEIVEPSSLQEIKQLYELLNNLYKTKVHKPLPHISFFESFYNFSVKSELGMVRLIKYQGKIIGGIIAPVTPGKYIYEWFVVGLDKTYKKCHPSILATWSAIDYAINNQLTGFDFMGLGRPEDSYGVRDFKLQFGDSMINYGRFGRRNKKLLYYMVELAYNIKKQFIN